MLEFGKKPEWKPHLGHKPTLLIAAGKNIRDFVKAGDHARVLNTMPDFLKFKPEANFGHYVMMVAALGEGACHAPGQLYSEYENSVGTGQVHVWFDRPAGGWKAPRQAAQ